jgi:curli biogenesis system outer membrane secretion channel CsgG
MNLLALAAWAALAALAAQAAGMTAQHLATNMNTNTSQPNGAHLFICFVYLFDNRQRM